MFDSLRPHGLQQAGLPCPSLSPSGFPGVLDRKGSAYNAGYLGSVPGLGRYLGEGKGYPLQYSGLEKFIDCIVHVAVKSQRQLSDFHVLKMPTPTYSWNYNLPPCQVSSQKPFQISCPAMFFP